jgi:hypothetical protein
MRPVPPPAAPVGRFLPWLPALAWAGLIFLVSARPSVPMPAVTHFDKLAHFAAYCVLGLCLAYAQGRTGVLSPGWMVLVGVLYGVSDELHQSFVPGRTAELGDWIADSLGVIAGVAIHTWAARRWPCLRAGLAAPRTPGSSTRFA